MKSKKTLYVVLQNNDHIEGRGIDMPVASTFDKNVANFICKGMNGSSIVPVPYYGTYRDYSGIDGDTIEVGDKVKVLVENWSKCLMTVPVVQADKIHFWVRLDSSTMRKYHRQSKLLQAHFKSPLKSDKKENK